MSECLTPEQKAIQGSLEAANINPKSFLATDYLNHYNEIAMLLEMVPDMPELAEDAFGWQPKSYVQHFRDSGFAAKELAEDAFNLAPDDVRGAFDQVSGDLDTLIMGTLKALQQVNATERGLSPEAQEFTRRRVSEIQETLLRLNKVIHGKPMEALADHDLAQSRSAPAPEASDAQTQEDIDKLFD
ncbi:hypothetical protein [Yunchengibacter salinarum]|uniref:hypothetical protein n=1 Tax=Yunchengibacter salinarum TaxID=3133399 RepID=UPI0035B5B263